MSRLAWASMALFLLVPAAAAQDPNRPAIEFAIEREAELGAEGFLAPEAEVADVRVELKVGCSAQQLQREPSNTVAFEVRSDAPYAMAIVNPAGGRFTFTPQECTDQAHRARVPSEIFVTTTRDAPAFGTFPTTVVATVEERNAAGGVDRFGPFQLTFNLTNDFLPLVMIAPSQYFQKIGPGDKFAFTIEVANLGNGETRTRFEVTQPNQNKLPSLWTPRAIVLQSRAQAGAAALFKDRVEVSGHAPDVSGYTNSIYSFNMKFVSNSTDPRGKMTDETTVTFSVQVQGTGTGGRLTPGPEAVAIVALVAIVAAWRRRHG